MDTIGYDPFEPDVRKDPYPYYKALREQAPVYWLPRLHAHVVSRYDDVLQIIKNPAVFSSERMDRDNEALVKMLNSCEELKRFVDAPALVNLDPPRHTRLRGLVNRAFTSARITALEPRIRELSRSLLRDCIARRECDFIDDLASPLPVIIIAEMLGVEPERRAEFRHWSNVAVGAGTMLLQDADPGPPNQALREFRVYLEEMIAARRKAPQNDLISALLEGGEASGILTPDEVVAFTRLLLIAGNETTTNLLGNALIDLLAHPDEMAKLRQDRTLIPAAIEEILRFDAPVQGLGRMTTQEVQIEGTTLPSGSMVLALIGSANRDPARFPDPDRFDISRAPQGALSFGHGVHFCLGAPLARLEARVALEELLAATSSISYAPNQADGIAWIASAFFRGPKVLRLQLEPAAG